MKKQLIACGLGGLLLTLCGCGPELAQVNYGAEEAEWTRGIQHSYRGYRPPRTAPPAIEDNVSPRLIESEENQRQNAVENLEEVVIPDAVEDGVAEIPAEAPKSDAKPSEVVADMEKVDAPSSGNVAADELDFTVYTVKAGDTLSKIAKEHYGDARKYDVIIKANGITNPANVRIGTKLQIPKL